MSEPPHDNNLFPINNPTLTAYTELIRFSTAAEIKLNLKVKLT